MVDGKHALVVVACLAGFGAWAGVFVQEAGDAPTYASELFGAGSNALAIQYPVCADAAMGPGSPKATCSVDGNAEVSEDEGASTSVRSMPWVRLHFSTDATLNTVAFDSRTGDIPAGAPTAGTAGEVTFKLSGGAQFAEIVASDALRSSATEATIAVSDGGGKGDDSVTFTVTGVLADDATLTFVVPRLQSLSALAAGHVNAISVSVTTRGTQGSGFPSGGVSSYYCPVTADVDGTPTTTDSCDETDGATLSRARVVVKDANAVTFSHWDGERMPNTGDNSVRIDIDNRKMLRGNTWTGPYGYTASNPYNPNTFHVTDGGGEMPAARLLDLRLTVMSHSATEPLLQWDGTKVDSDLAGVLDVDVTGGRGLFSDGDRLFVNFAPNDTGFWATGHAGGASVRSMDAGEALTVDGSMASFTAGGLSIDPGDVDEDDEVLVRRIGVFYLPAGKEDLSHGSTLTATASVNYTRSTTMDERPVRAETELRLHGVEHELKAYAIPFDGNGRGDRANLRIRCEDGDTFSDGEQCRAFLECWNDMGDRGFGEVMPAIMENSLTVLDAMEIEEDVLGMEMDAMTRHSCRVLATGTPSVQTLVNSGGTLVNNTFVED